MKKLFIFFLALLLSLGLETQAQDDDSGGSTDGIETGSFLAEATLSPFASTGLFEFGTFRLRYVASEAFVPRLGFDMNISDRQVTPSDVVSLNEYLFLPGVEYHLVKEGALDTYVSLDGIYGFRSASYESSVYGTIDGSVSVPSDPNGAISEDDRAYTKYGGILSVGADYYVSPKFYFGFEIGFELYQLVSKDVTVDGQLFQKSTKSTYGSIKATNMIRIGLKLF